MKKLGILISLLVLTSGCATARHYGAYFHTQWKIMYHTLKNTPQTCTAIDPSTKVVTEPEERLSLEEKIEIGKKEAALISANTPAPTFDLEAANKKLFKEAKEAETKILSFLKERYENNADFASTDIIAEPEEPEPVIPQGDRPPLDEQPYDPFEFGEKEPVITAENEPIPLLDLIPEDYVAKQEEPEPVRSSTQGSIETEQEKQEPVLPQDTNIFKAEDGSYFGDLCAKTGLAKTVFVEGHYEDGKYVKSYFMVSPEDAKQAKVFYIAIWVVVIVAIGCLFLLTSCICNYITKRDEPPEIDSG